jgi:hypothetical protein
MQRLIGPGLVGTERSSALLRQGDLVLIFLRADHALPNLRLVRRMPGQPARLDVLVEDWRNGRGKP